MKKLLISLLFFGEFCFGYAEIRTVSTLDSIQQEIISSPQETLVLLDVGGTLLKYPDAILHPSYESWKHRWFQTYYPDLSKEDKISFDRIILTTLSKWKLLDPLWPEVIVQAQNQGIKVVAFTKVAMDPSQRGSRAHILRNLGVPFKNDLPELSRGSFYEYGEGVVETEYRVKGPVLKEILSNLEQLPKKIIFVDDRMNQIESVNEACMELGISCVNFHYVPDIKIPELNEKIASYQLSTLVEEHRWVSDSESDLEMEHLWEIGGKIHFEEESGPDYIGIKAIHEITKTALESSFNIEEERSSSRSKVLLKKENDQIKMDHYEELHATLLYGESRGFCNSETLKEVSEHLFDQVTSFPTLENVAKAYGCIIKPEWRFKISEVILTKNLMGDSFIMAKLLFDDGSHIYKKDRPISAGLHMTLVVSLNDSILISDENSRELIEELNRALKGKLVKVAAKNGVADLEFGRSGSGLRIRAEQIQVKERKHG